MQQIDKLHYVDDEGITHLIPPSPNRQIELEQLAKSADFIDYCNTIYLTVFKWYKNQWGDKYSIPNETSSDFWQDALDDAISNIYAEEMPDEYAKTGDEHGFLAKLGHEYYQSEQFKLFIKQLKNKWKKELLKHDFR